MEPTASRPVRPEPAPDTEALGALLDCEADLDALERALLAAAAHRATGGADSAWLVRFDARRALLEGWRVRPESTDDTALVPAIARARRAPAAESPEAERVRAWACPVDALEGPCEVAWRTGEHALGSAAELPGAPWAGLGTVGVVPLRRGVRPYGLLVIGWRAEPEHDPALDWLSIAANVALAAQARAADARRRTRHGSALGEFARAAVATGNVAEPLHTLALMTAQALQVRHAAVFRLHTDGALRLDAVHGPAGDREAQVRAMQVAAADTARTNRPQAGVGADELPGPPSTGAGEVSVWALQPLCAYGVVSGVLAAWDTRERHPASPEWERGDLDTLATLADQAALLLEHSRRLEELSSVERRREDLAARLREQDRLAAVGELAARVAEEARGPLASMAAYATRALSELPAEDPRREYLEVVRREAERVEAWLLEQLAYAQLERPRLRMESLNGVVQEALREAAEALTRRRVRLLKKFAPDLPKLLLDAARIRRVVVNIVACSLESLPIGGRMRVETRRSGAFVVLEVVHDRSAQSSDALEQLFAPFGASPAAGGALGLGVAQQMVREHGGEIRVRTEEEWSSVVAVTLPVMDNQDRRKPGERRNARDDRRRRPASE